MLWLREIETTEEYLFLFSDFGGRLYNSAVQQMEHPLHFLPVNELLDLKRFNISVLAPVKSLI
jgi:hypothetical protein